MTDLAALERQCIHAIRFLAVNTVRKTQSGHPGTPMGATTMAHTLWESFQKNNPHNQTWSNLDRFILSAGHASMLSYALRQLAGYGPPLNESENFRQWGSKTPEHPECGLTPGVGVISGPLGQGFDKGTGMAMPEYWVADDYDGPGHEIIDHYVYAIVSGGDMQEGVTSEAAALPGTLRLVRLIYVHDANNAQMEGPANDVSSEDVAQRARACDWQVLGKYVGLHGVELAMSRLGASGPAGALYEQFWDHRRERGRRNETLA